MTDKNELDLTLFKNCSCGENVNGHTIKAQFKYSAIGWFFWSMGTTAIPKEIIFHCQKCDKIFEHLKDKEVIKHYCLYRKK